MTENKAEMLVSSSSFIMEWYCSYAHLIFSCSCHFAKPEGPDVSFEFLAFTLRLDGSVQEAKMGVREPTKRWCFHAFFIWDQFHLFGCSKHWLRLHLQA